MSEPVAVLIDPLIRGYVNLTIAAFGLFTFRVCAGGPWEALFYFLAKYPQFRPNEVKVDPPFRHPTGVAEYFVTVDKRGT